MEVGVVDVSLGPTSYRYSFCSADDMHSVSHVLIFHILCLLFSYYPAVSFRLHGYWQSGQAQHLQIGNHLSLFFS